MDLRCSRCGVETTYGDAMITDRKVTCDDPRRGHDFQEIED